MLAQGIEQSPYIFGNFGVFFWEYTSTGSAGVTVGVLMSGDSRVASFISCLTEGRKFVAKFSPLPTEN